LCRKYAVNSLLLKCIPTPVSTLVGNKIFLYNLGLVYYNHPFSYFPIFLWQSWPVAYPDLHRIILYRNALNRRAFMNEPTGQEILKAKEPDIIE
jgi:hypothetical protein